MKRIISILISVILLTIFCYGCSENNKQKGNDSSHETVINNGGSGEATVGDEDYGMDEDLVASSIKVTPYIYSSSYGSKLALILNNTSKYDCCLDIKVTFLNKNNKKISDSSNTVDAIAARTNNMITVFDCNKKFKKYKYEIKARELNSNYYPINQHIKITVKTIFSTNWKNQKAKVAWITVKNTSKKTIDGYDFKAHAIFFKNNKVVCINDKYIDAIPPKKSVTGKIECEEDLAWPDFDSVKVFISGYEHA